MMRNIILIVLLIVFVNGCTLQFQEKNVSVQDFEKNSVDEYWLEEIADSNVNMLESTQISPQNFPFVTNIFSFVSIDDYVDSCSMVDMNYAGNPIEVLFDIFMHDDSWYVVESSFIEGGNEILGIGVFEPDNLSRMQWLAVEESLISCDLLVGRNYDHYHMLNIHSLEVYQTVEENGGKIFTLLEHPSMILPDTIDIARIRNSHEAYLIGDTIAYVFHSALRLYNLTTAVDLEMRFFESDELHGLNVIPSPFFRKQLAVVYQRKGEEISHIELFDFENNDNYLQIDTKSVYLDWKQRLGESLNQLSEPNDVSFTRENFIMIRQSAQNSPVEWEISVEGR